MPRYFSEDFVSLFILPCRVGPENLQGHARCDQVFAVWSGSVSGWFLPYPSVSSPSLAITHSPSKTLSARIFELLAYEYIPNSKVVFLFICCSNRTSQSGAACCTGLLLLVLFVFLLALQYSSSTAVASSSPVTTILLVRTCRPERPQRAQTALNYSKASGSFEKRVFCMIYLEISGATPNRNRNPISVFLGFT